MINKEIDLEKHPASLKDAFWYWVVGCLGDVQAIIIEKKISKPVWRSFDGRVTTPCMMSDRHLENTVKLLEREFQENGEPFPPQYPALLRELHERRRLQAIRAQKLRNDYDMKMSFRKAARDAQLSLVPADWQPPEGWIAKHVATNENRARVYMHASGAKVSLNMEGLWNWWRAGEHHIPCTIPRIMITDAFYAALGGDPA